MVRPLWHQPGGIESLLLDLDREQWEALEVDLLSIGFVWADVPARVTWRALVALVKFSKPGSALYLVTADKETPWPRQDQLSAYLIDAINNLGWMYQSANSKDSVPRPPPFPQPGAEPVKDPNAQHFGSDPIPADEFDSWWANGFMDELIDD